MQPTKNTHTLASGTPQDAHVFSHPWECLLLLLVLCREALAARLLEKLVA